MNDWQDEWWKQIEKTATEMETFFTEVGETTELLVDEVTENVGSFFEQFQVGFGEEVEDFVRNFVDVIITTSDDIEAAFFDEWDGFVDDDFDFTSISYHTPSAQSHPACIGCANYHGHVYNGNLLVCAMHPQGMEDSSCPDWSKD
ncbi:MAG: hypothetical protein AAFQ23_07625 [Cyanobacteria bacterium J06623_1]